MNAKDIVKQIMKDKDVSNAEMADAISITQAALWDRLNNRNNKSMTISKLNAMLKHLGYELVILPRTKANRIDDSYVVDDKE